MRQGLESLVELVKGANLKGQHLEIGTGTGGTLIPLMQCYTDASRPKFVVVDPFTYFPNQRETVERNLRDAGLDPTTIDFRVGMSWALVNDALARRERFSFILIDGLHGVKEVTQDLRWTRILELGGYVCVDDYSRYRGVMWAVRWFRARHPQYEWVDLIGNNLAILRKTRPAGHAEVTGFDTALAGGISTAARLWKKTEARVRKRLRQGPRSRFETAAHLQPE